MLVYGDVTRREIAAAKFAGLRATLQRAATAPAGLTRHSLLIAALIDAGELAQGIADARVGVVGNREDRNSAAIDATMALVTAIAGRCALSWSSGLANFGALLEAELDRCAALVPAEPIDVKQPEAMRSMRSIPRAISKPRIAVSARAGK